MKLSTIAKLCGLIWCWLLAAVPRPIRVVMQWQCVLTSVLALIAGFAVGTTGAISALFGGGVMLAAESIFALLAGVSNVTSAAQTLRRIIRAESAKVGVIVLLLWVVLTIYEQVEPPIFIGAFMAAVLIYPVALLSRD